MRLLVVSILFAALGASAQSPQPAISEQAHAAQQALQDGRFEEAANLYQQLVNALPNVPGLRMNLGMALHMSGKDAEAVTPLREAWAADTSLHPAGLFLGASLIRLERWQEATGPLESVVRANPAMLDARRLLADAYMALGRPTAAIPHLQRLIAAGPPDAGLLAGLAQIYEQAAQESFTKLQQAAPESSYMLALLGEVRASQQQYPSAFYLYREALRRESPPPGIHAQVAHIYQQTGHADWAAAEQARARAEPNPDCRQSPAACHYIRGDYGAVIETTEDQTGPASMFWRTRAFNQLATMTFARLAELPPSVETHTVLAQHYVTRGQYPEAVAEWRSALKLAPGDPAIRKALAESLYGVGAYEEALAITDNLLANNPGNASLHWLRGDLLLALQRPDDAAPALSKALALDDSLTPARRSLGRALMDLGRDAEAIPHLEKALPLDEDGSIHFQLGQAYRAGGETEKAREMLAKYQEIQREQRLMLAAREEEVQIVAPDQP